MGTDVNAPEGAQVVDQIDANIERTRSLAAAGKADEVKALAKETEALISSLSGKGSIAVKKDKRADMSAAAATRAEASTEVVDPGDYSQYEGVSELVSVGAERVAEGVRLHLKASEVAKEIADVGLDMWLRIPNKDGLPDLRGDSHAAKEAMRDLYAKAGEGFERNAANEAALKSLQRAVQHQRGNVRTRYLMELNDDPEERKRFATILEASSEATPAEAIAKHYGLALNVPELSSGEAPKAIEPAGEKLRTVTERLRKTISEVKPEDLASAPDDVKEAARKDLEALYERVKAMIAATL